MSRSSFKFHGTSVAPGKREIIHVPLPGMYTDTEMYMPVHVLHGRYDGPVLFVSAAIHGDELNGVEIIRRLLLQPQLKRLHGTLMVVPIVNIFGFHNQSRYLPDRRDLNRSFPGRESGSMASRLAHVFFNEVVSISNVGIDLHTAAIHRENLPQIRANMHGDLLKRLAQAFGAPVAIHSAAPEGSLRHAAAELDTQVMVYEAGEALRFDEASIRVGLRGIMNVMRELGMIRLKRKPPKAAVVLRSSTWVRTPYSGVVRPQVALGDLVHKGDTLGVVSDPVGPNEQLMLAPCDGVVIGRSHLPLSYEGEAIFHIGKTGPTKILEHQLDALHETDQLSMPELLEEPEIV